MSYIGSWKIDDLLTFVVNTQVLATGVATDADSPPTYRVYEDETTTPILTGSMALLDSSNTAGFYSEQITLSAANGFEKGKAYSVYIAATVSSVAGTTWRAFQIQAEVAVASINAAAITATSIASDAITDAKVASDVTIASVTGSVGSVTGAVGSVTGNVGGNVTGSVGSVTGAVGSVTGTIGGLTATALGDFFDTNSGTTYASAVSGSVVKEIASNASGAGGPTAAAIADAVWDEDATAHQTTGTFGQAIGDPVADTDTIWALVNANLNATVSSRATQTGVDDLPTNAELATALGTADDAVLAQVALVKAKTDQLVFTVANQVDANIQAVNDVTVTGTGSPGDEWGP